jgi:hypothetical protein
VPAALTVLSAIALATFVWRDTFGVRAGIETAAPYALRFGRSALDNLLSYLGWTARIGLPWVRSFGDAVEPGVFPDGIAPPRRGCSAAPFRAAARSFVEGGVLWRCSSPSSARPRTTTTCIRRSRARRSASPPRRIERPTVSRRFRARRAVATAVVAALATGRSERRAAHHIRSARSSIPSCVRSGRPRAHRPERHPDLRTRRSPSVSLWFGRPRRSRGRSAGPDTA